ncbi:hypothetical protein H0H92_005909 [Tricholoma furcatifolium]|nr:hypothetical protein H0H92_005909 [Tricholoma furcatifolium]
MSFLNRIARVLGYYGSVNAHNVISRSLSASETLLVLDNAETFLHAPMDTGRIADAIDEFGARPNVVILLTTRTRVLPTNVNWIRIQVPSLQEEDACKAFKMFYSHPIETLALLKLLTAIDFHPLSINLLAQTAVQNDWSLTKLISAWNRQRVSLLEVGAGKLQSLEVTIETLLSSPSIHKFGDNILQFLRIVAFLPHGVNNNALPPRDCDLYKDALCKQSLAYVNGEYITLLAPIRLYIMSTTQMTETPLSTRLLNLHTIYWGLNDNQNVEHIFTYWLASGTATAETLKWFTTFIDCLRALKPRPVSTTFITRLRAVKPHPKSF